MMVFAYKPSCQRMKPEVLGKVLYHIVSSIEIDYFPSKSYRDL